MGVLPPTLVSMPGQLLSWTGLRLTWALELQDLHLQTPPKVHPHKLLLHLIALINGLKMVSVMLVMPQLVKLEYHTGLEITSVMMKTITLCVDSMAEIAVHLMQAPIGIGIAMIVNALHKQGAIGF